MKQKKTMMHHRWPFWGGLPILLIVLIGCRDDGNTGQDENSDGSGTGAGANGENGEFPEDDVCVNLNISLEERPVKMMILQDVSRSMENDNKWGQAQNALNTLLAQYESEISFGFDAFPNYETCGVSDPLLVDTALNNASNIASILPTLSLTLGTPLYRAMQNFTNSTYAPVFSLPDMDRYLLIVSDGGDTCYNSDEMSTAATPAQLGQLTEELLDLHGIHTFVIGFGLGTGDHESGESLNAIADAGGMLDEYIEVQDEAELTSALTSIGASVVSCTYHIGTYDPEEVDLDLVNVYIDDEAVPRDADCAQGKGWWWTDDSRTAIEFCDDACDLVESGDADEVTIRIMCNEGQVVVV